MGRFMLVASMLIIDLTVLTFAKVQGQDVELEKIVVTPYRMEISSEANGSTVEKVYVSELENKGISSLKEALLESSSIVEASSGSLGGDTSVFLRGHNSNHTRFMLDGIKIYDSMSTGAYYNFTHFNLEGIDRIEVSKGPQSSLYGSDAIGGVISIFTKKGKGKPRFTFQQKAGSYNTYAESLDFSGRQDKLGYYIGITRTDIGGYSLAKEGNNNHEKDPYHNLNALLRLDYDLSNKTQLELIWHYIYAKYEYDGSSWTPPYLPVDDDDNHAFDSEGILGLILKQKIADIVDYKLSLSSTRIYRKGWEDVLTKNWYLGKTYQMDNQFNLKLSDSDKLILGFDYLGEKGEFFRIDGGFVSDFPESTTNNKGYFIENIFNPGNNFLLSCSYRIDEHSSFGNKDTFRAIANYSLDPIKTKLKASYGTGFKAPSLYQLYAPMTAYGPIGNASLSPEESASYEVGIEKEISDNLRANFNYFNSELKNLIDFSYSDGYINIGKARIRGVESEFSYLLNKQLSLGLSYTWLDAENKNNHKELARRPSDKIVFKVKAGLGKLTSYFDLAYFGHRYSDMEGAQLLKPYILANISLNYQLKEKLNIFGRFEYIINEKYEEIAGYQTPKFSAYVGMKIEF
jgi:vitamin B12 transporter